MGLNLMRSKKNLHLGTSILSSGFVFYWDTAKYQVISIFFSAAV